MKQSEFEALLKSKSYDRNWCQLAAEAWSAWTKEEREIATIDDIEADVANTLLSIEEMKPSLSDQIQSAASTRALGAHSTDNFPQKETTPER